MASYRTCPKCKAYNTHHVIRCYKCSHELGFPSVFRESSATATMMRPTWMDSRAAERRQVEVVAQVLELNNEIRHPILIEDLGEGGLRFASDWVYREFDHLIMDLPLANKELRVEAIVRRCQSIAFGCNRFSTAVEFLNCSPELREGIGTTLDRPRRVEQAPAGPGLLANA